MTTEHWNRKRVAAIAHSIAARRYAVVDDASIAIIQAFMTELGVVPFQFTNGILDTKKTCDLIRTQTGNPTDGYAMKRRWRKLKRRAEKNRIEAEAMLNTAKSERTMRQSVRDGSICKIFADEKGRVVEWSERRKRLFANAKQQLPGMLRQPNKNWFPISMNISAAQRNLHDQSVSDQQNVLAMLKMIIQGLT